MNQMQRFKARRRRESAGFPSHCGDGMWLRYTQHTRWSRQFRDWSNRLWEYGDRLRLFRNRMIWRVHQWLRPLRLLWELTHMRVARAAR